MLQTTNVAYQATAAKAEVVRKSPAARRASSILASGTMHVNAAVCRFWSRLAARKIPSFDRGCINAAIACAQGTPTTIKCKETGMPNALMDGLFANWLFLLLTRLRLRVDISACPRASPATSKNGVQLTPSMFFGQGSSTFLHFDRPPLWPREAGEPTACFSSAK